jgi:coenzyme F420-reducing hydrogenase gamma subunit
MQNRLLKSLCEIAAKGLKITKGVNPQWKEKADLLVIAYGHDAVETDFKDWIESVREDKPESPVTEYLKLVDERLGNAPATSEDDPRVVDLIARGYRASGRPPSKTEVQKLLDDYSQEEIQQAWEEYTSRLDDNELKYAVKNFFHDGGARGIITARRQAEDEKQKLTQVENISVENARVNRAQEEQELMRRRAEQEEENRRIAADPDALFKG